MKKVFLSIIVFVAVGLLSYSASSEEKAEVVKSIDMPLKKENIRRTDIISISQDGKTVIYKVTNNEDKSAYFINDKQVSEWFDNIYLSTFSPDGSKVAYRVKKDNKYAVFINDKQVSEWFDADIFSYPILSPDGSRVTYNAKKDNKYAVFINDKQVSEWFNYINYLSFSPDSSKVTYTAEKDGKHAVFINDRRISTLFDNTISDLRFSRDGSKVVYKAKERKFILFQGKKWRHSVFINDKQVSEWFDNIYLSTFSPDGSKVAYGVKKDNKYAVFINDRQVSEWSDGISSLTFSPDGSKVAYNAKKDNKYAVFINDKQVFEWFDGISLSTLSPDGSKVAYKAKKKTDSGGYYSGVFFNDKQIWKWTYDVIFSEKAFKEEGKVVLAAISQMDGPVKIAQLEGGKVTEVAKDSQIIFPYLGDLRSEDGNIRLDVTIKSVFPIKYAEVQDAGGKTIAELTSLKRISLVATEGLSIYSYSANIKGLKKNDNHLRLYAVDEKDFGKASGEFIVRYSRGEDVTVAGKSGIKGWYRRQVALIVGINKYQNTSIPDLRNAEADARKIAEILKKMGFIVHELYGKNATKQNIIDKIREIKLDLKQEDGFLFYFSGHGQGLSTVSGTKIGYLMPYNSRVDLAQNELLDYEESAISLDSLKKISYDMKAKHVALFLDSCFSGLVLQSRALPPAGDKASPAYYETFLSQRAINVLTAGDDQPVDDGSGHSPFASALINAIGKGSVDMGDQDGFATFSELASYIRNKVIQITGRQRPQFGNFSEEDGEFVFKIK